MEIRRITATPPVRAYVLYAAWFALFFVFFFTSWVSEDAYITLRVVDNFIGGYGLRWNTIERVQVYTHPLWLLLHLPFAALWDNLFHLNIALSLICSGLAAAIMLLTFDKPLRIMLVFCVLPLFLSKAFIDYASSGLETPLSYLLFAMLGYALVHWQARASFIGIFSLLVALLLLNRLDHAVLLLPLVLTIAWQRRNEFFSGNGIWQAALGALPLLAWLGFSLLYYGFIFPNTKYAKLDTGLPLSDYLYQGLQYSFIWLTHDTLSVAVTLLALAFAFRRQATAMYKAVGAGIALNYAYIVFIGGDYMMGRFFAVPSFAAIWLLTALAPSALRGDRLFTAALLLLTAYGVSTFVRDIRDLCSGCIPVKGRVTDARHTFHSNALFKDVWPLHMRFEGEHKFAKNGKKMAQEDPPPIVPMSYVGMSGFYAGPNAIIVDELALGDAFLARLPARTINGFYVGHYNRNMPKGYMDAVREDKFDEMNPGLAEYLKKLRIVTQGDVWDRERLLVILRFNLGEYEHYKRDYLDKKE